MSRRRRLRRTLAAIPQNLFLWLGSLVVPALSRAAESDAMVFAAYASASRKDRRARRKAR